MRQKSGYTSHVAARAAVRWAVQLGRIPRASDLVCTDCGGPARHYDHHLGYAKEHRLDVQPVCTKCHGIRGRQELCARGHSMADAIVFPKSGKRTCRTCSLERQPRTLTGPYSRRPAEQRHGTRYAYVKFGCRCEPCKTADRDYQRTRVRSSEKASA